jgi:hypothetical protein
MIQRAALIFDPKGRRKEEATALSPVGGIWAEVIAFRLRAGHANPGNSSV